jgi:hypothetical protein
MHVFKNLQIASIFFHKNSFTVFRIITPDQRKNIEETNLKYVPLHAEHTCVKGYIHEKS